MRAELGAATYGLLHLHTVYTTRRERISSDEEERRRAGFKLETSYRFQDHGTRKGRLNASVTDASGAPLAEVAYGDSATVRITNTGRVRAKADAPAGYWLDLADGRWMNDKDAAEASGDSSELPVIDADGNERRRKKRVIPYVEDRRNILVVTLDEPLPEPVALSLMYALERGIEAAFELEDAELSSELLPPDDGPRNRILFTEAAEGGAGVLRSLQAEPDALAKAAVRALDICHFDTDGTDQGGPHPDRPCALLLRRVPADVRQPAQPRPHQPPRRGTGCGAADGTARREAHGERLWSRTGSCWTSSAPPPSDAGRGGGRGGRRGIGRGGVGGRTCCW
ncbi:hypothetical protein SVIOM342S_04747 [Streptomyces violaceorubidus]